jgi:hypothetical protein
MTLSDELSFMLFPTSGRVYCRKHPKKPTIQNVCFQQWDTTWRGSIMVWCWSNYNVTLHGWIAAREYVDRWDNQVHPIIQTLVPNNNTLFQKRQCPLFTQLELLSHDLKSMKGNFIFPGQHSHHIWTSLNHSGQSWRLEWGADSHLHHLS